MSEFDKRGIIARTKIFSLCIPSESMLNMLQHNVRCASIAATVPEIRADSYPHVVNIIICSMAAIQIKGTAYSLYSVEVF